MSNLNGHFFVIFKERTCLS